ncbi:MAG: glycoside hydrolase family 16 protein [Bacteroidetes bacterium]|nr:MAG: glycoside hydrolase family 16 protein [Bacteroidota bacterium]
MKLLKIDQYPTLVVAGLVALVFTLSSCEVEETQQLPERNWKLSWSDEFDGEAGESPDPTKWTYDLGTGDNGWGNGEFQTYTDDPENVAMDGAGNLIITARRAGAGFTSARIKTEGLFAQKYGRFEARLKTPFGPGIWPAFWMLGSNINEVSWPQCGEIDIMELRGQQPNVALGSVHGPGYSAGNAITASYTLSNARFDTDYHIFAIEWDENKIDFFVDDFLYQRVTPADVSGDWVFNDSPFFILLNVAVGGSFVGFPTSRTPFPQQMIIDYVRVYEAG